MTKDDRELIELMATSLNYFIRSLGKQRKDGTYRFGGIAPNDIVQNAMAANNAAATRLEALQAQPVGEAHKTEYGWLIELDGPQGLSYCIGSKFDPDHAKALRFARREDAQAFCDQLSVAHTRIAEHGWD